MNLKKFLKVVLLISSLNVIFFAPLIEREEQAIYLSANTFKVNIWYHFTQYYGHDLKKQSRKYN